MPHDTNKTTLPGSVQAAAPGLKGFDTNTVITTQAATNFKNGGYAYCARYLSLQQTQAPGDLSTAEATVILNAGLALIAVQHVLASGWTPSNSLGVQHGSNAAFNAASIGLPTGMNIWCDLEGIAAQTPEQAVIDYCTAWYNAVYNAGYIPGLYVGANCILDGNQLYDLPFQHYWQSMSRVPAIPIRGYQLIQHPTTTLYGVSIDPDTTQNDAKGGSVLWLQGGQTA